MGIRALERRDDPWFLIRSMGTGLVGMLWVAGVTYLSLLWLATQALFQQGRGLRGVLVKPRWRQLRVVNLHRTHRGPEPGIVRVKGEPRHYPGFAGAGRFDAGRKRPLTESAVSAVARSAEAPDGLDWRAFSATYFPGRRRHDLEAITAYGAYRRSHTLDEPPSRQATCMEGAESGKAGSTALQDWEDEGGAIR